jgi:hypothetical protein
MSPQFRSGGGGGMQTAGYEAAHFQPDGGGGGGGGPALDRQEKPRIGCSSTTFGATPAYSTPRPRGVFAAVAAASRRRRRRRAREPARRRDDGEGDRSDQPRRGARADAADRAEGSAPAPARSFPGPEQTWLAAGQAAFARRNVQRRESSARCEFFEACLVWRETTGEKAPLAHRWECFRTRPPRWVVGKGGRALEKTLGASPV